MNKARRKEIYTLIRELNAVQFQGDIDDCINTLENIKYDEESYYNNAPENLQYSQRYEASEEAIGHMDDALNYLNDAQNAEDEDEFMNLIEDAVGALEYAAI